LKIEIKIESESHYLNLIYKFERLHIIAEYRMNIDFLLNDFFGPLTHQLDLRWVFNLFLRPAEL
jgi:hypothetical protein